MESGLSLLDAVKNASIIKICCIKTVQTSPPIVHLMKTLKNRKLIEHILDITPKTEELANPNMLVPIGTQAFSEKVIPRKLPNEELESILSGPREQKLVFTNDGFLYETTEGNKSPNIICEKPALEPNELKKYFENMRKRNFLEAEENENEDENEDYDVAESVDDGAEFLIDNSQENPEESIENQ